MKRLTRGSVAALLVGLALASPFGAATCLAAERVSVSLSPSAIDTHARPGSLQRITIRVRNDGASATTIRLSPTTPPRGEQPKNGRSCARWVDFTADTVALAPGETKPVGIVLRIPPRTHGDYRAALMVGAQTPGASGASAVTEALAAQLTVGVGTLPLGVRRPTIGTTLRTFNDGLTGENGPIEPGWQSSLLLAVTAIIAGAGLVALRRREAADQRAR